MPVNGVTRLAQAVGRRRWATVLGKKLVPLDLAIQRRTGGKVSVLRLFGLPYLVLITTGCKTGLPRSVPLLYVPDGDDFVIAGSNWGGAKHPAWSANLLAYPRAVVLCRTGRIAVEAHEVTGAQRDRLWARLVRSWPAYETYSQRAGDRVIRVFVLRPR